MQSYKMDEHSSIEYSVFLSLHFDTYKEPNDA